ncbi:glycoside hydrolase family 31 protein [Filimonas effusa]|nr:TIM-barrel domain-containing protein [Filimonas effusa]
MKAFVPLFLLAFVAQVTYAAERVKLQNGNYVTIDVYTPSLIRIRVSKTEKDNESLMERYGVIKTQWPPVAYQKYTDNGQLIIETASVIVRMVLADGSVLLKRKNETDNLVDTIRTTVQKNELSRGLDESLTKHFGHTLMSTGIIGDSASKQAVTSIVKNDDNIVLSISLKKGERFYGLGNASREGIQHRGHAIRMWVQYQHSESPIPYIMSTKGWGLFYNTTRLHFFDVGRFNNDKMYVYEPNQQQADYFLFAGNNMQDLLNQYTNFTGKSYVLPRWAYGLAFGSNNMENQFNVLDNAYRFRQEQIPCDIYWLEPQWMAKYYDFSTGKDWNKDKFVAQLPWTNNRRALFIRRLNNMGYKVALWMCVDHDFSIEEEDRLKVSEHKLPSGKEHWFNHLTKFVDQGVSGFKLDPARTLDQHPERAYYNGRGDDEMHMLNQTLLLKNLQQTLLKHTGKRSFQHYCGGYAGVQHYGACTLGDNGGTAATMVDLFNLGMSGNSNISCDVLDEVDPLIPGMHMGFFLPWVQLNSWAYTVYPFYFSEKDKAAFRFYDQLRYQLNPYIYSYALLAAQNGMPMARPMPLIYPHNEKLANAQKQYLFGENFLIAAFTDTIDLPEGTWIDFWTNKTYTGNQQVSCKWPEYAGGPLFIKAGAIIPYQPKTQFIDTLPPDTLMLKIYPHGRSNFTLLEDDGETHAYETGAIASTRFSCNQQGKSIDFTMAAVAGAYQGMRGRRTYQLEFYHPVRPRAVVVNGKMLQGWKYNVSRGVLACEVDADVHRSYQIKVTY